MDMNDDLKKLLMHSVLQTDLDEKPQRPMTLKEEKDILHKFSDGEFLDSFNLAIIKNHDEPGKLFSRNALEKFLHTLRLYVGGRILGQFDKTGKSPEVTYVHIHIEHLTREEYESRMKNEN